MKVRRINYSADEFIAGVSGQLTPGDVGVYWMICSLIYSKGESIQDDPAWLSRLFKDTSARAIRGAVERLVSSGKVQRLDGRLMVKRCSFELDISMFRTFTATKNGKLGGRPPSKSKENNEIDKPEGLPDVNPAFNRYSGSDASTAIESYLDKSPATYAREFKKFKNGFNGGSGKWGNPESRDQYAIAECVKHLPGRDDGERWALAMAAEDPKDPNHRAAVTAMLAAAKKAKVGWVSPERRKPPNGSRG